MQDNYQRWLTMNLAAADRVSVVNQSSTLAGLHIAGPRSRELMQRLASTEISNEALPFLHARVLEVGPCPKVMVLRLSFASELGYEIYVSSHYQLALVRAIREHGAELDLSLAATRAMMSLRLEKGFPSDQASLAGPAPRRCRILTAPPIDQSGLRLQS
jgi:dimethylglycine dehydrogenase